jgi:hypothetical protein
MFGLFKVLSDVFFLLNVNKNIIRKMIWFSGQFSINTDEMNIDIANSPSSVEKDTFFICIFKILSFAGTYDQSL